jgi:hypothetical protein
MARKKRESVQLRVTVPGVAVVRLEKLADALATSVPDLLRFMVSTSLVQWETMYLHPDKFADAVNAVSASTGPGGAGMLRDLEQSVVELAPELDGPKKLGFGPRGDLELAGWVPEHGYMAGL